MDKLLIAIPGLIQRKTHMFGSYLQVVSHVDNETDDGGKLLYCQNVIDFTHTSDIELIKSSYTKYRIEDILIFYQTSKKIVRYLRYFLQNIRDRNVWGNFYLNHKKFQLFSPMTINQLACVSVTDLIGDVTARRESFTCETGDSNIENVTVHSEPLIYQTVDLEMGFITAVIDENSKDFIKMEIV